MDFLVTKDEFKALYKEAGFKNKNELAKALGLSHSSVNAWGSVTPFPRYVELLLRYAIKARKYDELIAKG